MKLRINYSYIAALSVSIIAALLIGAVVLLISGYDPLAAYSAMLSGAFSNARHIGDVLEYAMVLCLCGVACDIGSRVGIFNVGGEGQLLLGAIVAAQIGVVLNGLSPWIVIPVAALGAAVTGGIYALIPGWLKVKHRVNEVITTIMLNNIAEFVCEFLAKGPWKNPDNNIVAGTGNLPQTYWFTKLATGSNLTTVFFVATGMTILTWYIMQRTSTGYEMRLTGDNPRFARFTGIKTDKVVLIAMIVSGMMCGLVGMFRVYGAEHIYKASISNDYYFEGLMVAMIAKYQVLPTAVISVLFAILKIGAQGMETAAGVPNQIYLIIQTVVIFCMAAESGIVSDIKRRVADKSARLAAQKRVKEGSVNEMRYSPRSFPPAPSLRCSAAPRPWPSPPWAAP
ncbi:MAG: ABC transporter permease [Lachnospiraceae bacterium]